MSAVNVRSRPTKIEYVYVMRVVSFPGSWISTRGSAEPSSTNGSKKLVPSNPSDRRSISKMPE